MSSDEPSDVAPSPTGHGGLARPDDQWLLPLIRAVVAERASYGYRRVTALLNRGPRSRTASAGVHCARILEGGPERRLLM
jgi:hypothetical protein